MTTEKLAVYFVESAQNRELQLHVQPGPGAHCVLFGWDVSPACVDAGPPPILEAVFAAALVKCGTLAFLTASGPASGSVPRRGWSMVAHDQWSRLSPGPINTLLGRQLPWLMATRDPYRARTLFTGVSWSQQHQVGFLLKESQLPELTRSLVENVLGAKAASIGDLRLPPEVLALAMPAVDGDYLEVVACEQSTYEALRMSFAAECEHHGIPFGARTAVAAFSG